MVEVSPGDLPEAFELDTTMHLGDAEWSVVKAMPLTRTEFAKTKLLTLRLRKIERIPAGDILFSLPSICDSIPGLGELPLTKEDFVLADDEWRQFELVSRQ